MDYDIHGLIKCHEFFDYVHSPRYGVDLNLYDITHLIEVDLEYRHGETITNLLNPIFIDQRFPWRQLVEAIDPSFFHTNYVETEILRLERYFHCRTALHTYRMMLVPTHLLKTRNPTLNIYKIALDLNKPLEGIIKCTEYYRMDISGQDVKHQVIEELKQLLQEYKETLEKTPRNNKKIAELQKLLRETYLK